MSHLHNFNSLCQEAALLIKTHRPDFNVVFIPFSPGHESEALAFAHDDIGQLRSVDAVHHDVKAITHPFPHNRPTFLGPYIQSRAAFSFGRRRPNVDLCIFMPTSHFTKASHTVMHCLSAFYPALLEFEIPERFDGLCHALSKMEPSARARIFMSADWFGACATSLITRRDYLKELALLRARQSFDTVHHHIPEEYPAVVGYDSAVLAYRALRKNVLTNTPLDLALSMALEVHDTIPVRYVTKWMEFAHNVQALTWAGRSQTDILGMAVHTTEDIAMRAVAVMTAGILKKQPRLSTFSDVYNPFTPHSVNEKQHKRQGKALLATLVRKLRNRRALPLEALRFEHTKRIVQETPLGWAGFMIDQLLTAVHKSLSQGDDLNPHQLETTLFQAFSDIPWTDIETLHLEIHRQTRLGQQLTGADILTILETLPLTLPQPFYTVFSHYIDHTFCDLTEEKRRADIKDSGGLQLEQD